MLNETRKDYQNPKKPKAHCTEEMKNAEIFTKKSTSIFKSDTKPFSKSEVNMSQKF